MKEVSLRPYPLMLWCQVRILSAPKLKDGATDPSTLNPFQRKGQEQDNRPV